MPLLIRSDADPLIRSRELTLRTVARQQKPCHPTHRFQTGCDWVSRPVLTEALGIGRAHALGIGNRLAHVSPRSIRWLIILPVYPCGPRRSARLRSHAPRYPVGLVVTDGRRVTWGILCVALIVVALPNVALGAPPSGATASAAPEPTRAPATPSNPCGGEARLLATLNRPTVGYSSCAVPPGSIVLEEGYQNQYQAGMSPSVTSAFPQGFERVGVAKGLELDITGPNVNRSRSGNTLARGYSDLGLGFKFELPQAGRFTYALDGLFSAATGTGGFGAGGPTSVVNVDIAYAASPAIGFGMTLAGASTAGMTSPGTTSSGTTNRGRRASGISYRRS